MISIFINGTHNIYYIWLKVDVLAVHRLKEINLFSQSLYLGCTQKLTLGCTGKARFRLAVGCT